jgi:hypothetical protein
MTHREQNKYFESLHRFERKFTIREAEDYKLLLMRHKEDEDLDKESLTVLKALYDKYFVHRERKNFDEYFKKADSSGES